MRKASLMIPETSPSRYLSGIAALNIPSTRGTGDWHLIETFFRPRQQHSRLFVSGIGCETDTTPLPDTNNRECCWRGRKNVSIKCQSPVPLVDGILRHFSGLASNTHDCSCLG